MRKSISLIIITLLAFSISACGQTSDEDPQTVINKAWVKLADKNAEYESGEIDFDIKADLEVAEDKGSISGTGNLKFDSSDMNNAKTSLKADLSANGSLSGQSGKVDLAGELRTIGEKIYVLLDDLELDTGDSQTNLMANLIGNLYKSQWIELPKSDDSTFDLETENFKGKDVAEIAKKHNIFQVKEDLGGRKYELVLDTEELKAYFQDVAEFNDEEISAADLAAIDKVTDEVDYSLQVEIGKDYSLDWIKASLKADDPDKNQSIDIDLEGNIGENKSDGVITMNFQGETPGKIMLDVEASHSPKSVVIEAPKDAQLFDPSSLFGLGAGEFPDTGLGDSSASDEDLESLLNKIP